MIFNESPKNLSIKLISKSKRVQSQVCHHHWIIWWKQTKTTRDVPKGSQRSWSRACFMPWKKTPVIQRFQVQHKGSFSFIHNLDHVFCIAVSFKFTCTAPLMKIISPCFREEMLGKIWTSSPLELDGGKMANPVNPGVFQAMSAMWPSNSFKELQAQERACSTFCSIRTVFTCISVYFPQRKSGSQQYSVMKWCHIWTNCSGLKNVPAGNVAT